MPGSKFADLVEKPEMEVEGGARYKGQWRGTMRRRVEDRLCFFCFGVKLKTNHILLKQSMDGIFNYHSLPTIYHKNQPFM